MHNHLPSPGQVVRVRQRRWLVSNVVPADQPYASALLDLACLDDDAAGETTQVMWRYEVDARIEPDDAGQLKAGPELDDPAKFGAYLHALRWNTVTSTDGTLLQAPFRAGIDLKPYQLEPLRKALSLPRVNLFIADDVGLGKTIEAGLVLQELLLRQRIDRVLVVAPPAVTVQWQEELDQRFGLSFAIYDSDYVAARRRERGFAVNPWSTHNRFIVSYNRLRGTRGRSGSQHLELLINSLGTRAPRSLLIVDECHQVAPSTGSVYPADSRTTRAIRQLASRFEHRLFLSATPHNGHSSSFASLLHLLDPQRFTPGVPVGSPKELAPIMVRRLKRHLRGTVEGLPERCLVDHELDVPHDAPELVLARTLAQYDDAYRAALAHLPDGERAARALVLINLHKRLLSSTSAFHKTLERHAAGAEAALSNIGAVAALPSTEEHAGDAVSEEDEADFTEAASIHPGQDALALLDTLRDLSRKHASTPDARCTALADWVQATLLTNGDWNHERVVVFTEYQDTLSYIRRTLTRLLSERGIRMDGRIAHYTGQLGQDSRERLKAAFNQPPSKSPLRILLCTDAAREGINLQAHCKHLFHYDLPWNPSRIEQRNGRIDRVLQPSPQVFCHYFVIDNRPEDRVLTYVVKKLHRIREELGSLSAVVSDRVAELFADGLRDVDTAQVDAATTVDAAATTAQMELEGTDAEQLQGDLAALSRQLERSKKAVDYRTEHLRQLVNLGLSMVSTNKKGLTPIEGTQPPRYVLPPLDASWSGITDAMREPRTDAHRHSEPDIRPVSFQAENKLDADVVQLHLGHPLVKRLIARFRAQGMSADDLTRITALANPHDTSKRVVLFGRLSLYGHGATRLHEALHAVAGRITADGLEVFGDAGQSTTIEWLENALAQGPSPLTDSGARGAIRQRVSGDMGVLWPRLKAQSGPLEDAARQALEQRGQAEADAMTALLTRQKATLTKALAQWEDGPQLEMVARLTTMEKNQRERDKRAVQARLDALENELSTEPHAIRMAYQVVLQRFEPIGLAYLWPEEAV